MKRHSQAQMKEFYDRWQESGQSVKSFAIGQDISPTTFYYWVKKFGKISAVGFQHIVINEDSTAAHVVVHFPSGVKVEIHTSVAACFIKTLIG